MLRQTRPDPIRPDPTRRDPTRATTPGATSPATAAARPRLNAPLATEASSTEAVPPVASALSKAVVRTDMSLIASDDLTVAMALPAYLGVGRSWMTEAGVGRVE